MAVQDRASPSNKDLESIAQARSIAAAARKAQSALAELSQEQIDAIVTAMAEAVTPQAEALARLAVGSIGWMTNVTLEGTQELMKHRDVAVILATGGMGLVRAAYSSGKPAYGVGPGNAPCYIERSADLAKAASDIMIGKTFDNGVLCSSPNSVVVDEDVAEQVRRQFVSEGAYFMNAAEMEALAKVLVTPQRLPNPALVGNTAAAIARQVGMSVPEGTRALIAPLAGVGRDYPLSIEKLCPVLSYYVVKDWREGCERCIQILRYGGMGHTMSIHSQNEQVILEFGLHKPAFRIVVNSPTTHGSVGLSTGLDPAMTLGCGGYGGNITSDNISPRHLLNIKRLAYEVTPVVSRWDRGAAIPAGGASPLPAPPAPPERPAPPKGISANVLSKRIDEFLGARGFVPQDPHLRSSDPRPTGGPEAGDQKPLDFVCEEDVRLAIQAGRKLVVSERAIVTPAARDLAAEHRVFTM